jgi:membrane-associated phospholipid phosphatase
VGSDPTGLTPLSRNHPGSDPTGLTPRSIRLLWGLLVAGAIGFVLLALAYERHPLAAMDGEVAEWVATSLPSWAEWLARPPSWLGGWIGITAIGIVLGVVLVRERAWVDYWFLLATFAGSAIAVALLKAWFDRPRPELGSAVDLPSSAAFPSGHATAGVAGVGAGAILIAERLPSRRARVWLWAIVVIAAFAIGLSRIALNVHYVTDVLAGGCFGLAWLAACLLVRDAVGERQPRR